MRCCRTGFSRENVFEAEEALPAKAGPTVLCLPRDSTHARHLARKMLPCSHIPAGCLALRPSPASREDPRKTGRDSVVVPDQAQIASIAFDTDGMDSSITPAPATQRRLLTVQLTMARRAGRSI